jgi:hypothetical protein
MSLIRIDKSSACFLVVLTLGTLGLNHAFDVNQEELIAISALENAKVRTR